MLSVSALPRSTLLSENPPCSILQACVGVARPVIVFHSVSGKSRSPVGCIALMLRAGMSWDSAKYLVQDHRCADFVGLWYPESLDALKAMAQADRLRLRRHNVDLLNKAFFFLKHRVLKRLENQ